MVLEHSCSFLYFLSWQPALWIYCPHPSSGGKTNLRCDLAPTATLMNRVHLAAVTLSAGLSSSLCHFTHNKKHGSSHLGGIGPRAERRDSTFFWSEHAPLLVTEMGVRGGEKKNIWFHTCAKCKYVLLRYTQADPSATAADIHPLGRREWNPLCSGRWQHQHDWKWIIKPIRPPEFEGNKREERAASRCAAGATVWTCFQVGEDVAASADWAPPAHPFCVLSRQDPGPLLWPAPPWYLQTCRQTQRRMSRKTAWWCRRTPIRRWPRRVAGRSSPGRKTRHLENTVKDNGMAVFKASVRNVVMKA